jgi:hypothetical protein
MPTIPTSEIVLYKSSDGSIKLDVVLENETVWLTQEQMADLFGKARTTINEHIQPPLDTILTQFYGIMEP